MSWLRMLIVALALVSPALVTPVQTTKAAEVELTGQLCLEITARCEQLTSTPGTGGDLHLLLLNQCTGPEAICLNTWTLTGTFNKVVVERVNACTDGATCSINLSTAGAAIGNLQLRENVTPNFVQGGVPNREAVLKLKNRCDASSTCVITPAKVRGAHGVH
jgi:hypothetical protein